MAERKIKMYGPQILVEYDRGEKSGGRVAIELCPPKNEPEVAKMFTSWLNDPRVVLYMSRLLSCSESGEMEWIKSQNDKKEDLVWMIYVAGKLVGSLGLHRIDFSNKRAELGINIGDKAFWGKGVAQVVEACVLEYAFENVIADGLHKIYAGVLEGNTASRAALEKVGFQTIGTKKKEFWVQGRWFDTWEEEMLQEEWQKIRVERLEQVGIKKLILYPGCEEEGFKPIEVK